MEPQYKVEPSLGESSQSADDELPAARLGVGEILRQKRESFRQDLPTVAAQLHIRLAYLKAIEEGRFKDLPGMTYASGFVRSYADYLGLDGEEMVRLFHEEVAGVTRQVQLNFPSLAAEGRIPGGAVLMLSALLALMAYGVWYYLADRQKNFFDLVPEVPSQLRALLGKEAPPPGAPIHSVQVPKTVNQTASTPGSSPPASTVASAAGTSLGAVPPAKSAPAAPPPPPPPPATSVLVAPGDLAPLPSELAAFIETVSTPGPVTPAEPQPQVVVANPGARIRVVAHMDSWVQINDKAGKSYYAAILRTNQAIEVPNQPGLTLSTGNIGGIEILVDGQALPAMGPIGLVKRDLPLDPAGLKTAAAQ
ncbi:MAG TPA: RodZ domain-containing protein [Candidatus Udaeobacter sp.]|nr:RodZ domain-containing protein [Candidatus Udaeobacter sp.]